MMVLAGVKVAVRGFPLNTLPNPAYTLVTFTYQETVIHTLRFNGYTMYLFCAAPLKPYVYIQPHIYTHTHTRTHIRTYINTSAQTVTQRSTPIHPYPQEKKKQRSYHSLLFLFQAKNTLIGQPTRISVPNQKRKRKRKMAKEGR